MKKYLPVLAGLIITAGAISGTAFAGNHHGKTDQFGVQAACVYNLVPVEGADAEPLYWGACSADQVAHGASTVNLVILPEAS